MSSTSDIERALQSAQKKGPLAGIILDLRNNGGGYITEAVCIVGLFIKSGIVMESIYSDGSCVVFRDLDARRQFSGPIIILTSYETASAAEIVAQALKDYGRAIVVGDVTTYGKGSIQMQTVTGSSEDKNASNLPMKMTIGNFYTVSGFCPQGIGVQADIVLPSWIHKRSLEKPLPQKLGVVCPMYKDKLNDVERSSKNWYQEYYVPFIEIPGDEFRKHILKLKQKSHERIEHNSVFQAMDKNHALIEVNKQYIEQINKEQMDEVMYIMEDLLSELKKNGSENSG